MDGSYPGVPAWIGQLLRVSLPLKLVGANVLLLVAAGAIAAIVHAREFSTTPVLAVVIAALLTALLVNVELVILAVRPITMLEKTVDTLWHGDLDARVPNSLLADQHVARVGRMFNILLDGLVADRMRTRRLAAELINAGDRERATISRELHDSTAQSLAALVMQLSVAARGTDSTPREVLKAQLESVRSLATTTLEEVRLIAHTIHPQVLDDLGLVAALRRLAREPTPHGAKFGATPEPTPARAVGGDGILIDVVGGDGTDERIPRTTASVLYRVAQEALQNSLLHASPRHVEIRVWTDADAATVEVRDDGIGFNPDTAQTNHAGVGLFTMRERVALVDGEVEVNSSPGGGTCITASVPLHPLRFAPLAEDRA